mmetsp:Transcript_22711/g.37552  ORF Transcript_22711/g.37552 Transcript_22711/m.37552 type:complete len:404 (-) Transcript_22711:24-1235(-)
MFTGLCNYTFTPTMTVFGGSNTAGANASRHRVGWTSWGRPHDSFAKQFVRILPHPLTLKWNAEGGGGPIFAAACSDDVIPSTTRYATIEYLPNIGFVQDDVAELNSIKKLLKELQARKALTFVVNIYSGTQRFTESEIVCRSFINKTNVIGCLTQQRMMEIGATIEAAANKTGAHVISMYADHSPALFGADSFHLNQAGHDEVFKKMRGIYEGDACTISEPAMSDLPSGVKCINADHLQGSVLGGNFEQTNLSPLNKELKVAWVSRTGANMSWLDLAIDPPAVKSVFDGEFTAFYRIDRQNVHALRTNRIKIGVGFLTSRNHSFDTALLECIGCTCKCDETECKFLTHRAVRASVTAYKVLYTNTTGRCTLRVSGTEPRKKILIVEKLIVGLNDFRTRWLRNT